MNPKVTFKLQTLVLTELCKLSDSISPRSEVMKPAPSLPNANRSLQGITG